MRSFFLMFVLSTFTVAACLKHANVPCEQDSNCDLGSGGVCTTALTGNRWCAYPNISCPSGLSYSTQAVGDGVSGTCVAVGVGTGGPGGGSNCKTRIAFEEGPTFPLQANREVWIANTDGSGPINVSMAPTADDYGPTWSPDNQRVAFLSNRSGVYDIYAVNSDGTNLVNLTPGSTEHSSMPVWSPDGAHMAFFRSGKVWVMNADGTNAAPISDLPVENWLAWSPDARKLAFDVVLPPPPGGMIGPVMLYVSPIDGSTMPMKLSSYMSGIESHVSWAPASKITWNNANDIFVANPDGTSLNVTEDAHHWNTTPRLTPDGQTIVFGSDISGNAEIWSVASSGGIKTALTHNAIATTSSDNIGDIPNSISADGSLVAFSRLSPGTGSTIVSDIGVVDIHGLSTHIFNVPGGTNARSPTFSTCRGTSAKLTLHQSARPTVQLAKTME